MFSIALDEFTLHCHPTEFPDIYSLYHDKANLAEEFDLGNVEEALCFVAVTRRSEWPPLLSVAQRYSPAGYSFYPGVLLVPETSVLFIGAGERLLAYDLQTPKRLWSDTADCGFWSWQRHGAFVLMSGELEFAAWTAQGKKLWTMFVEPPWEYMVEGDMVDLEVMGNKRRFPILSGPQ